MSCYMLELYNDKLLDLFGKAGEPDVSTNVIPLPSLASDWLNCHEFTDCYMGTTCICNMANELMPNELICCV